MSEELRIGKSRRARAAASITNGRMLTFTPAASYWAFRALRRASTCPQSTRNTECAWADVRRLAIMCSAIFRRIAVIGSTVSPGLTVTFGPLRNFSTSAREMRDPAGVTAARSMPCTRAMTRATGEALPLKAVAGAAAAAFGAEAAGVCATAGAAATEAVAPAEAAVSITATTECTSAISPAATRISTSTPATGEGISASTLSVEISSNGSSRPTESPTCFNHRATVPSAIDSPIWGITTSVRTHGVLEDGRGLSRAGSG